MIQQVHLACFIEAEEENLFFISVLNWSVNVLTYVAAETVSTASDNDNSSMMTVFQHSFYLSVILFQSYY
jgi:hypothetical protein